MSRTSLSYYYRLVYAAILFDSGRTIRDVAFVLNRDRSTVAMYLKKFDKEISYNESFRWLATGVDAMIRERPDMTLRLGEDGVMLNYVK